MRNTPTMSKRHFEFIASVLRDDNPMGTSDNETLEAHQLAQWRLTVKRFARELSATNPQFKRETFLRACGLED